MFNDCTSLTTLDVSQWYTKSVTIISGMFTSCSNLTTLDLSGWDTSSVTTMQYMFMSCSSLKTIYASDKWSTSAVTNSSLMFLSCNSLVGGAGTTLSGNPVDATYARIDGGTESPGYFTLKSA